MPKLRAGVLPRWRQDLLDRLARLEARKPRGITTVTDWAALFLGHMEQVGYQPATVRAYFYFLRCFWRWCEAHQRNRARHIKREDAIAFLRHRIDDCGVSRHWVGFDRHRLAVFFGFLQRQDVLRRPNPAVGIGFYRHDKRQLREVLSHDDCRTLVQAPARRLEQAIESSRMPTREQRILAARDTAILGLMLGSGLRRTEIAELTLDGLSLERGLVRVCGKGRQRLFRVERDVFIHPTALDALRNYLALTGDRWSGPVFLSRLGDPIGRGTVGQIPVRHARIALGKHVSPHLLRHTFATHVIQRGADPHTAQRLLGHKDVATTLHYYLHLTPEEVHIEWRATSPVRGGHK